MDGMVGIIPGWNEDESGFIQDKSRPFSKPPWAVIKQKHKEQVQGPPNYLCQAPLKVGLKPRICSAYFGHVCINMVSNKNGKTGLHHEPVEKQQAYSRTASLLNTRGTVSSKQTPDLLPWWSVWLFSIPASDRIRVNSQAWSRFVKLDWHLSAEQNRRKLRKVTICTVMICWTVGGNLQDVSAVGEPLSERQGTMTTRDRWKTV